ncbi:hypothetical protein F5Y19DRAFT_475831 [Xylariaceae sp. FL1651]|nr:hypothetical protein F5Y19DRAFT_475831 [Xylariaceae sp. FL1651]
MLVLVHCRQFMESLQAAQLPWDISDQASKIIDTERSQEMAAAPFVPPSRKGDAWFFAGLSSSFPNLTESGGDGLCEPRPCGNGEFAPGCKVFHVPSGNSLQALQIERDEMISHDTALQDQVLVFQYKGKIHAVDNMCPHSAFPLAKGAPFDIEDFGVVLSAGIACPKHGWSFDLFTGRADRNNYTLRRWEVQLRPVADLDTEAEQTKNDKEDGKCQEVWVRRRQRIG